MAAARTPAARRSATRCAPRGCPSPRRRCSCRRRRARRAAGPRRSCACHSGVDAPQYERIAASGGSALEHRVHVRLAGRSSLRSATGRFVTTQRDRERRADDRRRRRRPPAPGALGRRSTREQRRRAAASSATPARSPGAATGRAGSARGGGSSPRRRRPRRRTPPAGQAERGPSPDEERQPDEPERSAGPASPAADAAAEVAERRRRTSDGPLAVNSPNWSAELLAGDEQPDAVERHRVVVGERRPSARGDRDVR